MSDPPSEDIERLRAQIAATRRALQSFDDNYEQTLASRVAEERIRRGLRFSRPLFGRSEWDRAMTGIRSQAAYELRQQRKELSSRVARANEELQASPFFRQQQSEKDKARANAKGTSGRLSKKVSQTFENDRLSGRDFSKLDLRGSSFHRCDLTGCNFSGSNLEGIRMTQCTIDRANFEGANLQKVKFFGIWNSFERGREVAGSTMTNCNFKNADLRKAMLAGCDLVGSTFVGADLRGTDFRGTASTPALPQGISPMDAELRLETGLVKWDKSTVWPSTFRP